MKQVESPVCDLTCFFFFGNKLKDKEKIMLDAIDGNLLVPEYPDDYLQEVKKIY